MTSVMPFPVVWFFRGRQSARAWKQGEPDRFVPQLGQALKDGFFQNSEKGPLIPAIFMGHPEEQEENSVEQEKFSFSGDIQESNYFEHSKPGKLQILRKN